MSFLTPPVTPVSTEKPSASTPAFPSASKYLRRAYLPTPPYTPEYRISSPPVDDFKRLSVEESTRPLSENELSYYLPCRADGVNDM